MAATIQPERLIKELGELWVSLAASEPGHVSNGVLRACAMTLIVLADEQAEVGETLARLMHEHPSRAIVIRIGASDGLKSRVFAECWMPFGKRQQICCEQIEITAGASDLHDLPSVLRGITVPDLPVVLWAPRPDLLDSTACEQILPLVDKIIVDSAMVEDGPAFLDRICASRKVVADLAWGRVTPWRESVAAAFETGGDVKHVDAVREVVIEYSTAEPAMEALYLQSWFGHVLGSRVHVALRETGSDQPAPIERVRISGEGIEATLSRAGDTVIELQVDSLTLRETFPPRSDYELLREELSIIGHDAVFEAVRKHI